MRSIFVAVMFMVLFVTACSTIAKNQMVIMKIEAGAQKVLVTGCKDLPATEVAIGAIEPFVPPGSTTTSVEVGIALGETAANKICAVVATQIANKIM